MVVGGEVAFEGGALIEPCDAAGAAEIEAAAVADVAAVTAAAAAAVIVVAAVVIAAGAAADDFFVRVVLVLVVVVVAVAVDEKRVDFDLTLNRRKTEESDELSDFPEHEILHQSLRMRHQVAHEVVLELGFSVSLVQPLQELY